MNSAIINDIHIYLCDINHLELIYQCQKAAIQKMRNPEWYYPSTKAELNEYLKSQGNRVLAISCNGHPLVAFSCFIVMEKSNCSLVSIEDAVTSPDYQNLGLQKKLWRSGLKMFSKDTRYICTIHPQNLSCLHIASTSGFKIIGHGQPYDSTERFYLEKAPDNL